MPDGMLNNGLCMCTAQADSAVSIYTAPNSVSELHALWRSAEDTWIMGQNNRKPPGEVIRMMRGECCCLPGTVTRKRAISQGGAVHCFHQWQIILLPVRYSRFPENKKQQQNDNKTIPPLEPASSYSPLQYSFFSHC
jgi:hypothetical protein